MVVKIRLENIETKLRSSGRYTSHSELLGQKLKDNFYKKLGHLIWKYKSKSAYLTYLVLINGWQGTWIQVLPAKSKDKKFAQEVIRED